MNTDMLEIKTVHQCNCRLGGKTLCPQACIIRMDGSGETPDEAEKVRFGFYSILLIEHENGEKTCCGCNKYDFSDATMVFLPPERPFTMDDGCAFPEKGWLIAFQKELFCNTRTYNELEKYSFFSYDCKEALHLSLREKNKILECIHLMDEELRHPADCHSEILLVRCIELILDYCTRYYERQFITREELNNDVLVRFERLLDEYWESGMAERYGLPTVKYFADKICLSPNYFGDLVKAETGKTAREHIHLKIIEMAKNALFEPDASIKQIADTLGFQYPQHFLRFFKKEVGCTPKEYRSKS